MWKLWTFFGVTFCLWKDESPVKLCYQMSHFVCHTLLSHIQTNQVIVWSGLSLWSWIILNGLKTCDSSCGVNHFCSPSCVLASLLIPYSYFVKIYRKMVTFIKFQVILAFGNRETRGFLEHQNCPSPFQIVARVHRKLRMWKCKDCFQNKGQNLHFDKYNFVYFV